MSVTFYYGEYKWPKWYDINQKEQAKGIIREGVREKWSKSAIIKELRERGLGYRRTNMLHDISLAHATGYSKTEQAYDRALSWFKTIEQIRVDLKLKNREQAIEWWKGWVARSHQTLEDAEEMARLEDIEWTAKGGTP